MRIERTIQLASTFRSVRVDSMDLRLISEFKNTLGDLANTTEGQALASSLSSLNMRLSALPEDQQQRIREQFMEMFERHQTNKSQSDVDNTSTDYLPGIYFAVIIFAVLLFARLIKHVSGKPKKMRTKIPLIQKITNRK